jgi:hypothetical protein
MYLTAKLSASPRSPRDVCNVYAYLVSPASTFFHPPHQPPAAAAAENNPPKYCLSESQYQSFHARLLAIEARVFYALSFNTHVALPHPLAVTYLQALDFLNMPKETIAKRALAYLNAALLSPQMLYCTSQPNALAVAAIYNAARDVGAKMPECEWWEVFDVDREELGFLVVGMRSVEGWGRKIRGEEGPITGWNGKGMLTKRIVQEELKRRGIEEVGEEGDDVEAEMARRLDKRMAELEGGS